MRHRLSPFAAFLVTSALSGAAPALAQAVAQDGSGGPDRVSLTIYNQNIALVEDTRSLDVPSGRSRRAPTPRPHAPTLSGVRPTSPICALARKSMSTTARARQVRSRKSAGFGSAQMASNVPRSASTARASDNCFGHHLVRKPAPAFRDHALDSSPAIHRQHHAGDEIGIVRREINARLRNIVGL